MFNTQVKFRYSNAFVKLPAVKNPSKQPQKHAF